MVAALAYGIGGYYLIDLPMILVAMPIVLVAEHIYDIGSRTYCIGCRTYLWYWQGRWARDVRDVHGRP